MSTPTFKDYFSEGAAGYAEFRPRYPAELFRFVASLPSQRRTAWDCATGSGQAAVPLADYFTRVIATDASGAQLAYATSHPRVEYSVALADASGIPSGTVDLVTVAQALHWLPRERFFAEVRRVAAPGGALAVWCYSELTVDATVDPIVHRYYAETCGPYWAPERALVDAGYRAIEIPIDEVEAPPMSVTADMTLDELAGYLRTWSATRKLAAATGRDPVVEVFDELLACWGTPTARRTVRWPLHVRAGRVRRHTPH